jgi:membrane protease YdiL (CAAX protease family)|tara:strand:+ start:336 stop:746 length:411 start_codon:yes stop_codon:yes gene_type:complete
MIQRIQTIYLVVSAIVMGALFMWFPVVIGTDGSVIMERSEPLIFGLIFISIALAIISILSFKKRQLQFVLNRLNIISNFVLLGVFVYRLLTLSGETIVSEKGIGVLFPIISIVFLVLANKAIKRDEDLVKSVDRLR